MKYTFSVPGIVRGKQRARSGNGRHYTPKQTVNAEAWIKQCAVTAHGNLLLQGPLKVEIHAISTPAPSWSKTKTNNALCGIIRPTGKPDTDNIAKIACDSLNGIWWKDDSQVVTLIVHKFYGPEPELRVSVEAVDTA